MALYDRLLDFESPKVRIHQFMAALGEIERGFMTEAEVATAFGLSAGEQTELTTLVGKVLVPQETICFNGAQTLTNVGAAYDTLNVGGVALVQQAGITKIVFGIRVNKIGVGTQDWQLWRTDTDGTNGAQVGVISDAGGTGVKDLNTTIDFDPALGPGLKILRVRAKSSTATDDPILLGATLLLRRVSRMTAVELHEILCLAERRIAPYNTVNLVKTRLGV